MSMQREENETVASASVDTPTHKPIDQSLRRLVRAVQAGEYTEDQAMAALRQLPFEKFDQNMCLDHHRAHRCGFPEVVYSEGKTPEQVAELMKRLAQRSDQVLATRAGSEHYAAVQAVLPDVHYQAQAGMLWLDRQPQAPRHSGLLLIAAGTCDVPVLEQAAITADLMRHEPRRLYDVGVAGLHRLLAHWEWLQEANVIVVAAGMDAALLSVVVGLVQTPVIALPTSVGYGASFEGIAALLTMLNACAPARPSSTSTTASAPATSAP